MERNRLKIHFYVNAGKPEITARKTALAAHASRFGLVETDGGQADVIIALGGDGTILRAVHEFRGRPVLGLNLGGLGYLSAVGGDKADQAFRMLAEGRFSISRRSLVGVWRPGEKTEAATALNDIDISRGLTGHAVLLDLSVGGKTVTRYMADGLVFATPTGSTAYSLAAGGPVVLPDSPCLVVTPMNPHALGVRPLVVRDNVRFTVRACPRTDGNVVKAGVYADGENVMMLEAGECVEIAKSRKTAKLVALEGYDPFDVLARKLGWNGNLVSKK